MTISSQITSIVYPANGVQTAWNFNFLIPSDSAGNALVQVLVENSDGTSAILVPSSYSISGVDNPTGGTVVYPLTGSPLQSGQTIVIMRAVPYTQLTAVSDQAFFPHTVEDVADWLTMQTQQLAEVDARALQFRPGDAGVGFLPPVNLRKGLVLGFDATTGAPVAVASGGGGGGSSAWSALTGVPNIISAIDVLTPASGQIVEFLSGTTAHMIATPSFAQNFSFAALTGVPGSISSLAAGIPASGQIWEYLGPSSGHFIATPSGGGGGGNVSGPGSATVGHLVTWNSGAGTLIADSGCLPSANGYSLISAANYAAMRGLLGIGALGLLGDLSTVLLAGAGLAINTTAGVSTLSVSSTPSANTWDPANKSANITLSGGNQTATATSSAAFNGVRGTQSKNGLKVYFEVTITPTSFLDDTFVGCQPSGVLVTGTVPGGQGGSNLGWAVSDSGVVFAVGGNYHAVQGSTNWTAGPRALTWQIAVDMAAAKVWVKPVSGTGSTKWNNITGADPATGAGGLAFNSGTDFFTWAGLSIDGATASAVSNTGGSSFLGSIPTGFTAWDSAAATPGVTTVNGRAGAVSLTGTDVSTGLGAVLNNGTTGKLAAGTGVTFSYNGGTDVLTISAPGGGSGVSSFNGRSGAVSFGAGDVAPVLSAGSGITLNNLGATVQISATGGGGGGVPINYNGAAENSITTAQSATTNTTNLNNLISTLNTAGGGTIWINGSGAYNINGTINLKSNVNIIMDAGAWLTWTGAAGGTMVASSITAVLVNCTLRLNLDEGTSFTGTAFFLHSAQYNDIIVEAQGFNSGSIFAQIWADSTAGEHPHGGRNTVFNRFTFRHHGQCQYGIIINGLTSGFGGQAQGVTDNEFRSCQFNDVVFRGIKINEWADTNTFSGNTYAGLSGLNGIGLVINEGRTNNYSVYNTVFQHFAIDTFGTGLNRKGVVLFESKMIVINQYFQDPQAEAGAFTNTAGLSYLINMCDPGANTMTQHYLGWTSATP